MVEIEEFFSDFDIDLLKEICYYRNVETDEDDTKEDLIAKITRDVVPSGIRRVLSLLKLKDLLEIMEALHVKPHQPENEKKKPIKSKPVCLKLVVENLEKDLEPSLKKQSIEMLKKFLKCIQVEESDIPTDKDEIIDLAVSEINAVGIEVVLSNLPADALHKMCEEKELKVDTTSKPKMIDSLLNGEDYKKKKKKKTTVKVSKHKPKIVKGISKEDLNSWYLKTDLEKWLQDADLNSTGNKRVLIKRIIDSLEGIETTPKREKRKAPSPKNTRNVKKKTGEESPSTPSKEKAPEEKGKKRSRGRPRKNPKGSGSTSDKESKSEKEQSKHKEKEKEKDQSGEEDSD
eukprot:TRINITY_DN6604_c0_g1_i1.p1 TRINITY_DN6604_c0_g1~~TRINITY_DN6604_c0_g1_i1.p1  ORF type:complete len:345 (-),score=104.16 TRINITY_DN6604_c0_g1_i1:114-1148(-)